MPILTFLSGAHTKHNPPAEFLHGHAVPYYEAPERVERILSALTSAGLITAKTSELIQPETIALTQAPELVTYLRELSINARQIIGEDFAVYDLADKLSGEEYYYESIFPAQMGVAKASTRKTYIYDNTSPVGPGTWDAALSSASAAYAAAQAILDGENQVYALCRPPGHHAGRETMGGYCYLNNAGIAATHLKTQGRVAILDVDYHHGNGTQDIFWDDPDVLYVSIHVDPAVDYPYYAGFTDENHATNLNIPLPHGTSEQAYLTALETAIAAIQAFVPASLVISLGFDTYRDDPMGRFDFDIPFFAEMGKRIASVKLPTVYVQEGGYNVAKLGEMAVTFMGAVEEITNAASAHSIA